MKEIRRTEYDEKPENIMYLGDGTYYYNYDIQEEEAVRYENDESVTKTIYTAVCIMLQGNPSYKNIVKGLIRAYYTSDEEFDLINSYNEAVQNGLAEGKDIDGYKEYLVLRNNIKSYVKQHLA